MIPEKFTYKLNIYLIVNYFKGRKFRQFFIPNQFI